MEARPLWFTLCLLLICGGCSSVTPDPSVQLLEGELRWMEDQLYMMEDQLQMASAKLNACTSKQCNCKEQSPVRLRRRRDEPTPATRSKSSAPNDTPSDPDDQLLDGIEDVIITPPENNQDGDDSYEDLPRKTPAFDDIDADDLKPPAIELPGLNGGPAATKPPSLEPPPISKPELDPNLPNQPRIEPQAFLKAAAATTDKTVTHVAVNTRRIPPSRPHESEVVRVVVQPRNVSGQFVAASAPVSVLIARNVEGADSNPVPVVAWDFDVIEANHAMQQTSDGTGIHLDLPWPAGTPLTDDMIVQVQYNTVDGRTLDATQPINNNPTAPSELSFLDKQHSSTVSQVGGWTPANRSGKQIPPASAVADNPYTSMDTTSRTGIKTRPIDATWIDGPRSELSAEQESVQMPVIREALQRPTWQPYR